MIAHYQVARPSLRARPAGPRWRLAWAAAALWAAALTGCGAIGRDDDDPPERTTLGDRTGGGPTTTVRTNVTPPIDPGQVPIASPPARVEVAGPATAPTRPRAAPPTAPTSPTAAVPGDPTVPDRFGFDGDRYLSLVTPEEMDVLRLRARGDAASHLSRFLTEKERENLRRRAAELTEIGAEPLRVGE